ncbi:MAG: hypothetical protein EP308_08070 [Burkholderiales bacterium]|nr:MAG: hypothetical protein EP308_08070 [Burkholderiales bacterium]
MWRLLHRVGTAWMSEVRAFYRRERRCQPRVAVDILLVAQAFGTHDLVPLWLLKAFLSLHGNPNRPRASYHPHLEDLYGLNARMGLWAQSPALGPVLEENVHALIAWANRQWCGLEGQCQPRLTLNRILGLVREHEEREQADLLSAQPWQRSAGLVLDCKLPGYRAVLIGNARQLWEEGKVMRHCADHFRDRCAEGDYYVISLRPERGGRPLATIGVRRQFGRHVMFHQVTGFANAAVTSGVRREAVRLAAQLGRQLRNPGMNPCVHEGEAEVARASVSGAGVADRTATVAV